MSDATSWPRRILSGAAAVFAAGAVSAAGSIAFGHHSARQFGIRYETLPVLRPGQSSFRILHIGDMHLVAGDHDKIDFVRGLAELEPDVVVNTGDNPGGVDAIDDVLTALEPLLSIPGVFVPGSNDLYGPRSANPLRYLTAPTTLETSTEHYDAIDVNTMFRRFAAPGAWHLIANRNITLHLREDLRLTVAGTHDAHMRADVWPGFDAGTATAAASTEGSELRVAVTHAPYRRVLDAATADGADVIFAGHTHGGQVALPAYGAIVSNCDLPTGLASGVTRWRAAGRTSVVNITAGIGASPTVPLRTFCPPEAVVVDLIPADRHG